ncbi:MAG: HXXEE domain-containing protein [Paludibacteraceae bacterium]|nr:HXXEE domain-containing protein [Paludibacteraceae bacterium]
MMYHELIAKGFTGEPYSMFFHVWPWIGLGAAVVILLLVFCTDFLRSDKSRSRWFDPAILAWLGAVAYMLHNVEEYGVDMYGNQQAFTTLMYQLMGVRISELAFLACNLCLVWVVGPLTAVFVRKGYWRMAAGMALFELINALMHVVQAINLGCYNPGLLTSGVIFLPLCCWTLYVLYFRKEGNKKTVTLKDESTANSIYHLPFPKMDILWLFLGAFFYHIVLMAGIMGATKLGLPSWLQGTIMVLDAVCLFYFWWLVGKKSRVQK